MGERFTAFPMQMNNLHQGALWTRLTWLAMDPAERGWLEENGGRYAQLLVKLLHMASRCERRRTIADMKAFDVLAKVLGRFAADNLDFSSLAKTAQAFETIGHLDAAEKFKQMQSDRGASSPVVGGQSPGSTAASLAAGKSSVASIGSGTRASQVVVKQNEGQKEEETFTWDDDEDEAQAIPAKPPQFSAASPCGTASSWRVEEVLRYLESLELGHVGTKFKENGIDGQMLLDLSEEDLVTELGLTKLQARKVRQRLPF